MGDLEEWSILQTTVLVIEGCAWRLVDTRLGVSSAMNMNANMKINHLT